MTIPLVAAGGRAMSLLLRNGNGRWRVRLGLIFTLFGFLVFLIGAEPDLFSLDRSPVMGYVQISVFLLGLGIICLGGYMALNGLWNGDPKSIAADIGLRLVATGYVIAIGSGLADLLGFGSHPSPILAYFGPWQMRGVLIGQAVIAIGFVLLIPYRRHSQPVLPDV
jgi:hypothetical protein